MRTFLDPDDTHKVYIADSQRMLAEQTLSGSGVVVAMVVVCAYARAHLISGPHHRPGFLSGHPDDLHLAPTGAPVSNFG